MMMRGAVLLLLGLTVACRPTPQPAARGTSPPATVPAIEEPAGAPANPSGRWHVVEFLARADLPDDQRVAGLDEKALTAALVETVGKMPQVQGYGPAEATVPLGQRAAVMVAVSWQLLDDAGHPRSATSKPSQGTVIMTLMAHAERPVAKGEPEIAERTLDVSLPLSEERAAELGPFLTARLQEATAVATADVLGELWARGLDEAAVLALLDDDVLWRRVAGAREAGERGLKAARERLEKAARDSRKDLAVVAAAALGRLSDPRSVPVLIDCLGATRPEVVDAALGALTDIGSAPALAAIQRVATEHGNPEIRQRAAALLQGRAARQPGRQAEQAPAPTP